MSVYTESQRRTLTETQPSLETQANTLRKLSFTSTLNPALTIVLRCYGIYTFTEVSHFITAQIADESCSSEPPDLVRIPLQRSNLVRIPLQRSNLVQDVTTEI